MHFLDCKCQAFCRALMTGDTAMQHRPANHSTTEAENQKNMAHPTHPMHADLHLKNQKPECNGIPVNKPECNGIPMAFISRNATEHQFIFTTWKEPENRFPCDSNKVFSNLRSKYMSKKRFLLSKFLNMFLLITYIYISNQFISTNNMYI